MSDWSDDDIKPGAAVVSASSAVANDDWVSGRNDNAPFESSYGNEERGGRGGGRGRGGRGRGRGGGNFRNDRDNNDQNMPRHREDNDFKPRRRDDQDDSNRDGNNNGEDKEKKREIYIPSEETSEADMFAASISAGINFDKFENIEVKVSGEGTFLPISSFEESGLREYLLENVRKSGYKKPTPIQKYTIPIVMGKRDMMGCAQTGSGKTAAFILPILDSIMSENTDLNPGAPQCLIVAPTRELVIQIYDEARKFALGSWVKVCLAYGGAASNYQSEKISRGCHILVATPGRLFDFLNKTIISFVDLKFLVLDEADRMLDMGFRDSINKICTHETINKENVVTLMFSATFPQEVQMLASNYLKNYLFLTVGIVGGASTDVEQEFIEVSKFKKRNTIYELLTQCLSQNSDDRILVFVETKRNADFLASYFAEMNISATSIHGDRLQREREEALRDFRTGKRKVLVATAVAARGLDIKGVTHVINYDMPKDIDEYVHRIGRTGRVGNRGKATSFYDPENNSAIANDLIRILKQAGQPIPTFFNDSGDFGGETDRFGGSDIRPTKPGEPQCEDEDW